MQQPEPAPGSARQPVEVLVRFLRDDGEMEGEFDSARRALTELVAVLLDGAAAERVRIGRRCPRCAGTDHGRPVLEAPARAGVHVSLARTRGRAAVAASLTGPIGIDVERLDPERFDGVATVALGPDDGRPATLWGLATQWVRKEAVLKATGTGLTWDPSRVDVSSREASPFSVTTGTSGRGVPLWVSDLPVDPGYVAAVAVVSRTPHRVRLLE